MTYAVLPDIEQALVTFLAAHASLVPMHGGRVSTKVQSTQLCLQVTPLGGTQPWPWEAFPEFQIASWGGTKAQANLLARTLEAAVYDLIGPVTGGHIRGVAVQLSQLWSPDDQTSRARYITQISCTCYPEGP